MDGKSNQYRKTEFCILKGKTIITVIRNGRDFYFAAITETKTKYGQVRGVQKDGYTVPAAFRTQSRRSGEKRFCPPEEPACWEGVYKADHFDASARRPSMSRTPLWKRVLSRPGIRHEAE